MTSLITLKGTTKSRDLYEAILYMLKEFSLSTVNISSIVTDSIPVMEDKRQEFVKLIQDNEIASSNLYLIECHYIALQHFCVQTIKMGLRDGLVSQTRLGGERD